MHKDFPRHFIYVTEVERTFDLSQWVDESGFPKIYENGIITSTKDVGILQIPQSMYMGKNILNMGIDDYRKSIFGEVSLTYNFVKEELSIDYNVSPPNNKNSEYPAYMDCMTVNLYNEEEYFQQSTVQDLPFEFDEQYEMKAFFDEMQRTFSIIKESGKYAT